ncbi:hypothetical protein U1E44_07065 [Arenibacter sp. GZD96]|uniref:hypothetical protein n=1 Tax=Aurantibrevibacter litoralis TaxID=3106030 RepID=UPI002AFF6740|nr:hypothetical protein [Arenibacter sp. GZD-96]MEA1785845.1 hypothetical protein [Arenibacter sp. GZD-96]
MKKIVIPLLVLFSLVYFSSCDGNEDDSGILIIQPVDSTQTKSGDTHGLSISEGGDF